MTSLKPAKGVAAKIAACSLLSGGIGAELATLFASAARALFSAGALVLATAMALRGKSPRCSHGGAPLPLSIAKKGPLLVRAFFLPLDFFERVNL